MYAVGSVWEWNKGRQHLRERRCEVRGGFLGAAGRHRCCLGCDPYGAPAPPPPPTRRPSTPQTVLAKKDINHIWGGLAADRPRGRGFDTLCARARARRASPFASAA